MAGCSSYRNGFSSCVDVDIQVYDECEDRLRNLFDQVLSVFLKEECYRPRPVIIGGEESVDLFKLFMVVEKRGGFDSVSRDGLWEFVAKQLGLDRRVSPAVRLVYSKYLDGIEKWMRKKSRVVKWTNMDCQNDGCFGALLHELGDEFRSLLKNGVAENCRTHNESACSGFKHLGKFMEESRFKSPNLRKRIRESSHDDEMLHNHDGKKTSCLVVDDDNDEEDEDDDVRFLDSGYAGNDDLCSRKGKQETLPGMMRWLSRVAKGPHDPSIGQIPDRSKWKEHKGNEYWIQVIRAKQALLTQRSNVESRTRISLLQSYQKMHPSIYDEAHQPTKRLRCNMRHLVVSKARSCSCCSASPGSVTKQRCSNIRKDTNAFETTSPERKELTDLTASCPTAEPSETEFPRRYVSVGAMFQARVPRWTGAVLESDSKWQGMRVWPLKDQETSHFYFLKNDLTGEGRSDSCGCEIPDSVECIRFHIAESRIQLKRELGPVFFIWRFNHMGEEISLRWTDREQNMFKDMVTYDSQSFWENARKWFPRKTRQDLVSYYFNVFQINRRRYQNRVTPRRVDSDDDEYKFGSVGYCFGHEAVQVLGSDIMICSQNSQCIDLD